MLNFYETRYTMDVLDNFLPTFLLVKQKDYELHEYTRRFKTTKQVFDMGGPLKFTKNVNQLPIYDKVPE